MADNYFETIIKEKLFTKRSRLQYFMESIYSGIDFRDKRFLDIGGGAGLHSYYAANKGARKVLCLEPEVEGSSCNMYATARRLQQLLNVDNVSIEKETLQSYVFREKYDIILMHNSINHLDEPSCINLLKDKQSLDNYRNYFRKIAAVAEKKATVIVCDCSCSNLFALLNLPNPFARTIEWNKHQRPETWSCLLSEVGFTNPRITWRSFNSLGTMGNFFLGNKYAAYLLHSHFCLRMTLAALSGENGPSTRR